MIIWLVVAYSVGYLTCCVIMNKFWYKEFDEYNVYWPAIGSLLWPIFAIFWLLGTLGKIIAKALIKHYEGINANLLKERRSK